ncbi:CocE/NonD family hydrolase [Legionella shakespearei]|uniref:Cocaine esterase n=1 Tax=Legionella shakespearei DSM 23087 TaxID=1122169 RepID=A0A0W0YL69_9GAMM|nr:CocE/NonD family hydrolase [Legionella shakespearei]KTD57676.1 Cocaine esterase [Legionella shakespearei DSM 23087]
MKIKKNLCYLILLLLSQCAWIQSCLAEPVIRPQFYRIENTHFTMRDGVSLAATIYRPVKKGHYPVLLEVLPYRKDDSFANRNYQLYPYFAAHGLIMVSVDIRGTGSSGGKIPLREYSNQELDDIKELVLQLSQLPDANGNVGMWGISWGAFNAIMTAMDPQKPSALKAILIADGSDDIFYDDVHFIDGIFHVDSYELDMESENILPSPANNYSIDEEYFQNRFNRYPWFLNLKAHNKDSKFWQDKSLRKHYQQLNIPVFMIGGLSDGYRDSVYRMIKYLDPVQAPSRAIIGPWNHAWPHNSSIGPQIGWRKEALQFWHYYLKGAPVKKPEMNILSLFQRDGHLLADQPEQISGNWLHLKYNTQDVLAEDCLSIPLYAEAKKLVTPHHVGFNAGDWWGEIPADMKKEDRNAYLMDSKPLKADRSFMGMPFIQLKVSSSQPRAHFVFRLEDVAPDGSVTLVTGKAIHGDDLISRINPAPMIPYKVYDVQIPLHFSTWTFKKRHIIRLSLSTAQFPMFWPTPVDPEIIVHNFEKAGQGKRVLSLQKTPDINSPLRKKRKVEEPDSFDGHQYTLSRTAIDTPGDLQSLAQHTAPPLLQDMLPLSGEESILPVPFPFAGSNNSQSEQVKFFDQQTQKWVIEYKNTDYYWVGKRLYSYALGYNYQTPDKNNGVMIFHSESFNNVFTPKEEGEGAEYKKISTRSLIDIRSDKQEMHIQLTRQIWLDNELVGEKSWNKVIGRR